MNFIDETIAWLQLNWGVTLFGGVSLGTIISTVVLLAKQWVANKAQGTKYETLFNGAMKATDEAIQLYKAEKEKNGKVNLQNLFMQQSQAVLMDAIIKMALSSKLDSDDKAAIVGNLERLKLMAPVEVAETVKDTTTTIITNAQQEITENPTQTVFNVVEGAASLLDKYTQKKEV